MHTLYHYNKCSKSRNAQHILEESNIQFVIRLYVQDPLSREEILALRDKLNLPLIEMVRTSEKMFLELFPDGYGDEDALIHAIVQHPILLQRPILETQDKAIIARPPEKVLELI